MIRLALLWLTVALAVNCDLFGQENDQEHEVVPGDADEIPALLQKGNNKLLKPREAPSRDSGVEVDLFRLQEEQGRRRELGRRTKNAVGKKAKQDFAKMNRELRTPTLSNFEPKEIDMADLCNKTLKITKESEFVLLSPTTVNECNGVVIEADSGRFMSMACSVFNLSSQGCEKESLNIEGYDSFCQENGPSIIGTKSLRMSYNTSSPGNPVSFNCTIKVGKPIGPRVKASKICGECGEANINPNRIVGGQKADKNEYPWMVVLMEDGSFICGGSLIAPSWVITAFHCITGVEKDRLSVAVGSNKNKVDTEDQIEVDEIESHPDLNEDTFEAEIVLLHLKKPVVFSDNVRPICIAKSSPKTGAAAVVTGWGALTEGGKYPKTLYEVEVDITGERKCKRQYKPQNIPIKKSMICAARKEKDSCQGDSGGPLIVQSSSGEWTLVGVVSFGIGCARDDFAGVYVRISSFNRWIRKTVGGCK